MSDTFETVTKQGYFQRISKSIGGVFFGIILFLASFGVLFWNEGRADYSKIAETSVPVQAESQPEAQMQGKFVSTTGKLTTDETIGDQMFLIPGNYLSLHRNSEMYAWEETSHSETQKNVGGSETTKTTYTYNKKWTSSPSSSSSFKKPQGHENPPKTINSETFKANNGKLGVFEVNVKSLDLPGTENLTITKEMIFPEVFNQGINLVSGYLYKGSGSLENPQIGDIRISYNALKSGVDGTIFAKIDGNKLVSFTNKDNKSMFRMLTGDRESAIQQLKTEHKIWTWVLRGAGFIMMLAGLSMIFAPISVVLDFIPIFGSISRGLIGFVIFIVSFILSGLTILISILVHNIIYLIIFGGILFIGILIILGIVGVLVLKNKDKLVAGKQS